MSDFIIMKKFKVDIHPPRAPVTKEIIWSPHLANWIKGNKNITSSNIYSSLVARLAPIGIGST
jgi:hypothetical protein